MFLPMLSSYCSCFVPLSKILSTVIHSVEWKEDQSFLFQRDEEAIRRWRRWKCICSGFVFHFLLLPSACSHLSLHIPLVRDSSFVHILTFLFSRHNSSSFSCTINLEIFQTSPFYSSSFCFSYTDAPFRLCVFPPRITSI